VSNLQATVTMLCGPQQKQVRGQQSAELQEAFQNHVGGETRRSGVVV